MVAGSLAYHAFLAVFPVLIALIGVSQMVGLGRPELRSLVRGIGRALPEGAASVLGAALTAAQERTAGALTLTIVAVVVALWSASGGMVTVEVGLDMAYEVPAERRFLAKRLVGLAMLGVLVVLGGLASALVVFGQAVGRALAGALALDGPAFADLWTALRWAAAIVVVNLLFALFYQLAPNRPPPPWRWFSPGGLVGAAIWLLASLGLSLYVSALGSYARTYGALAGVAVLLLWFYLSSLALLLGAEVNSEVERAPSPDAATGRA